MFLFPFIANYLEPLCYLIYAIVLFDRLKYEGSISYKILFYYYVFGFAIQLIATLLANNGLDNNWAYNVFYLITVLVLSNYFHEVLTSNLEKLIVKVLVVANIPIFYIYILSNHGFFKFDANFFGFSFLCIAIYAILFIKQVISNMKKGQITLTFDFWLVCSYLIYFLGAFTNVLFYGSESIFSLAVVFSLANITLLVSVLIAVVGVIKVKRTENSRLW